ncbi:bifunctional oligoribonuclease/PAP phosphatase NrnA [Thermodesulfobacteriota bacterium]
MKDRIESIAEAIRNSSRVIISTHKAPEGDAIGSMLALLIALRDMGKVCHAVLSDDVPACLKFLPLADQIQQEAEGPLSKYDLGLIVDCTDPGRAGIASSAIAEIPKVVNIDHHRTNSRFGDIHLVDENASATGELVCRVLKAVPSEISPQIATAIFTAVITDTGSFHFSNSTPESFHVAGEMVACGAIPSEIANQVFVSRSPAGLQLLGLVLSTLEFVEDDRIGSAVVLREMIREVRGNREMIEGVIDHIRAVRGVDVAILFGELGEGIFKVSFRSKGNLDVAAVASKFGGGGHKNAAGCMMYGSLEKIMYTVHQEVRRIVKGTNA